MQQRRDPVMDAGTSKQKSSGGEKLPPPPPTIPPNMVPHRASEEPSLPVSDRMPMERPGLGTKGQKLQLLTNHFRVKVGRMDDFFYQYSVCSFLPYTLALQLRFAVFFLWLKIHASMDEVMQH